MIDMEALRAARRAAGLSQAELARRAHVAQQLIGQLERGEVRSTKAIYKIAEALEVAPQLLDSDIPGTPPRNEIPIVGYVGAGASIYPIDDHSMGDGFDTVPAPPGVLSGVALIVRGDSMWPKYEDGEIIVCEKSQIGLESLIGRTCYVQLADGRALLKILARGSSPGYWTLLSHNAPPIENAVIERAYPIAWTKPRR